MGFVSYEFLIETVQLCGVKIRMIFELLRAIESEKNYETFTIEYECY